MRRRSSGEAIGHHGGQVDTATQPWHVPSTRNIDNDRVPAPGLVTATTCRTSAKCDFVIHPASPRRGDVAPPRRERVAQVRHPADPGVERTSKPNKPTVAAELMAWLMTLFRVSPSVA
jgi:hypothetical protein